MQCIGDRLWPIAVAGKLGELFHHRLNDAATHPSPKDAAGVKAIVQVIFSKD